MTGRTSDARIVHLVVPPKGFPPKRLTVNWVARCQTGARFRESTLFPFRSAPSSQRSLHGVGTYHGRYRSEHYTIHVSVNGHVHGRAHWEGHFRGLAVVRQGGRVIDRCRTRRQSWFAGTPKVRLQVTGPDYEPDLNGGKATITSPPWKVNSLVETPDIFSLYLEDPGNRAVAWRVALNGRRTLRKGRHRHVGYFAFVIEGPSGGCDQTMSDFTLKRLSRIGRGFVRDFNMTFVQRCEGFPDRTPLRGTFHFWR